MKTALFSMIALAAMLSVPSISFAAQQENSAPENVREGNYIFTLNKTITRQSVAFKNRYGIMLVADLYMPQNFAASRKYPALIIGSPYGGVSVISGLQGSVDVRIELAN